MLFGLAYIASGAAEAWQAMRDALPQVEAPRWGARLFGRWRRGHGSFDGSLAGYTSGGRDCCGWRDVAWVQQHSWACLGCESSPPCCHPDPADVSSGAPASRAAIRRVTPGFLHQFYWSLGRAMLKRLREPLSIFTDYAIFALTGGWVVCQAGAARRPLSGCLGSFGSVCHASFAHRSALVTVIDSS